MKMIKETSEERYVAPKCKTITLHLQGLVCQSFGEPGEPGDPLPEEDPISSFLLGL